MPRAVARRRPGRSSGQSRGPARSRRPLRAESVDGPSDSLLPPLSGSGTGMGSTAFYLVVLVCETFRMPVVTMSEMVAALRATVGKRGMPEEGLLTTRQEEVMIKKGKMWRIHYWILRVERIKAFAKPQRPKTDGDAFAVYNTLPDDIWSRQLPAR